MVIKIESYKIYVHINKINGKLYFGQTKRNDVNLRFGKNGIQYKKCPYFWNAIQKYGWDNFEHIVIFENLSKEMADIIEKELIKKYDTTNYNLGYNLSEGGGNNSSIIQKEVYQYSIDGILIKKWESAQHAGDNLNIIPSNISACCNGRMKTYKGYIWKYKSNNIEYIENIDDYLKRKTPKEIKRYHKKVVQYDLNDNFIKLWDSALDANKHYAANEKSTCVQACCRGDRKSAYGFIWKYVD